MKDQVAQAIAAIDAIAVPLGVERMELLGEDLSGAGNFYAVRLRRGTIFSNYEPALARALLAWPEAPGVVHEIGGGFGGLSILLGALGFRTTCLEVHATRFAGAEALLAALGATSPSLADNCRLINARFPLADGELPYAGAMAVITNLVVVTAEEAKTQILSALKKYPMTIIDVDRFLTSCRTLDERVARLEEFRDAGLVGDPFLDLGRSACFYRFHPELGPS